MEKYTVHLCKGTNNQLHTAESFGATNHCTSGEEIFHLSCSPKVHDVFPKPATEPCSQPDYRVHTIPYFLKIHSNVIHPYMPRSRSKNNIPSDLHAINLLIHATCFAQLIYDLTRQIIQILITRFYQSSATSSGPKKNS